MHFSAILGTVAVAVISRLLFKTYFSPLRNVPGPTAARFTNLWYLFRVNKGDFQWENIELHRRYGPIVRYGPNRYSLSSPSAQKIIYGHGAKFPKSAWYATSQNPSPQQWSLFADRSIQRHGENRRQYQSTYSMSSLVTYEPYVDECTALFSQRLREIASAGAYAADMGHWLQCYAFDVIGLITYAKRLGFLDKGEDVQGVIAALEDFLWYAACVGIFSWLHEYLFPVRNWLAGPQGTGRAYVGRFTQERIKEHEVERKKKGTLPGDGDAAEEESRTSICFLSKFFAKNKEDPAGFTMYHLAAGCVSNMVAGSDTTAISLSAILYYLLKNPGTFDKLRQEVDERKHGGFFTLKESQEMPYLQAVMKEALRLHPAVGLPLERVVPPGGATICEQYFPEGTIVGINSWVAHRDTSVFGPDAHLFKPERWLSSDKERLSLMERSWMPFGLGSRTCIGRHISLLEMSKLVPALIRDFDFTLDSQLQEGEWKTVDYWFVKPKGFKVKVALRQPVTT
ncbi:CypX Cytochrome P450 [Pyrenophora tritici-repentis]|nr:CypX cytochrome P450 [Pyrenophora tritici-repentis]KAI0610198.1 CypX Cytochrome P450 [Pyrenophora tritici-repentis]KAI0622144.1 CypX Cytochrome P450 [Pyrenophora tritici-repentis]